MTESYRRGVEESLGKSREASASNSKEAQRSSSSMAANLFMSPTKPIPHEICIKKDRKIVFFFVKNVGNLRALDIDPLLSFRFWQNTIALRNIYWNVDSLADVHRILKEQFSKSNSEHPSYVTYDQLHEPTKIVFNLKKTFAESAKLQFQNIFYTAAKVEFVDCSVHLISEFCEKSRFKDDSDKQKPRIIAFRNCKIDDQQLRLSVFTQMPTIEISEQHSLMNQAKNTSQLSEVKFDSITFEFKNCPNITDASLSSFERWNSEELSVNNPNCRENIKRLKGSACGLGIHTSSTVTPTQLIRLASQPFFTLSKWLKLKQLSACVDSGVMKEILSYRQEIHLESPVNINQFKELSFDRSVCQHFDDLPLTFDFKQLTKLSYKGQDSENNQKDVVDFTRIFSQSMPQLTLLKLKSCVLTKTFFQNLSSTKFIKGIYQLNFKDCTLDVDAFKTFLTSAQLPQLRTLNLSGTNIDDHICSLIAMQSSLRKNSGQLLPLADLKNVDVSNIQSNKFTQKGVKFLLQGHRLMRINICNNACIEDSLADFLIHLTKRRRRQLQKLKETNFYVDIVKAHLSNPIKLTLPKDRQFEIIQLNLSGCKNITSSFFMALQSENILKDLRHLNVSNTSVCNNFVDLLLKETNQQSERQADRSQPMQKERNMFPSLAQSSAYASPSIPAKQRQNYSMSSMQGKSNISSSASPQMSTVQMNARMSQLPPKKEEQSSPTPLVSNLQSKFQQKANPLTMKPVSNHRPQLANKIKEPTKEEIDEEEDDDEDEDEEEEEEDGELEEIVDYVNQSEQPPRDIIEFPPHGNDDSQGELNSLSNASISQVAEEPKPHLVAERLSSNVLQEETHNSEQEINLASHDAQRRRSSQQLSEKSQSSRVSMKSKKSQKIDSIPQLDTSQVEPFKKEDQQEGEVLIQQVLQKQLSSEDDDENLDGKEEEVGSEENEDDDDDDDDSEQVQSNQSLSERSAHSKPVHRIPPQNFVQEPLIDEKKTQEASAANKEGKKKQEEEEEQKTDQNSYYVVYGELFETIPKKKLRGVKKIGKSILRGFDKFFGWLGRRAKDNLSSKSSSGSKGSRSSSNRQQARYQPAPPDIEDTRNEPMLNLQFLSLAGCKLITADKLCELMTTRIFKTMVYLNLASTNLISAEHCLDSQKHKNILQSIFENMPRLNKLDISDNLLPRNSFVSTNDYNFSKSSLIKLKANLTNFDLEFFSNSTGSLHELQLQGCKGITASSLRDFIIRIGKSSSAIFDIFKLLQYFRQLVTDDLIELLFKNYIAVISTPYVNLSDCPLLELNYDDETMLHFLETLLRQQNDRQNSIECIDLSSTRVTSQFVQQFLHFQKFRKGSERISSLILKDCPMIDGSIFHPFSRKPHFPEKSFPLTQRTFKAHSLFQYIRSSIRDEDLSLIEPKEKSKAVGHSYFSISLEGNQLVSYTGFGSLLSCRIMRQVESLNLSFTLVNDRVLKYIRNHTKSRGDKNRFQSLKSFSIKGCLAVTKQGLLDLCQTVGFHENFSLDCAFELPHLLDLEIVKAVSNSQYFENMTQLDLSKYPHNDIDQIIAQLCLKGRDTELRLKTIILDGTRISDIGLQFISVSKNLSCLQRIYFQDCPLVFDKGISYLLESVNLKSLDIQHLILQSAHIAKLRSFDTFNYSTMNSQIKELVFNETRLTLMEIEGLFNIMIQLTNLQLVIFGTTSFMSDKNVVDILDYAASTKITMLIFPPDIRRTFGKEHMISFDYEENCDKLIEEMVVAINKKDSKRLTKEIENVAKIVNIKLSSLNKALPDFAYFTKFRQNSQPLTPLSLNLRYFIQENPKRVDDLFLDSLLVLSYYKANKTLNLKSIDLSGNKQLSNECLIRFFYLSKFQLSQINISRTLAKVDVIVAILANSKLDDSLFNIIFNDCEFMNYQQALWAILIKRNNKERKNVTPLQKSRILFRHKTLFDDDLFNKYMEILSQQHAFSAEFESSHIASLFPSIQSTMMIKLYVPRVLDLQGSSITLRNAKLNQYHMKEIVMMNFANTPISMNNLCSFCSKQSKIMFSQQLRYMYIDNTPNITDANFSEVDFFNKISFKSLNYNEFLYSKGNVLYEALDGFFNSKLPYVTPVYSFQFEYFPHITYEKAMSLLENHSKKQLNQVSFAFNRQNSESFAKLTTQFQLSKLKQPIQGIIVKQTFKGGLLDDKNAEKNKSGFFTLFENVNPFAGLHLRNDVFQNYVDTYFVRQLDLSATILSGKQLIQFFSAISTNNCIEQINLSRHPTITDLTIMAMTLRQIRRPVIKADDEQAKSFAKMDGLPLEAEEVTLPQSMDPNERLIEQLKPLRERRKKNDKHMELTKYLPSQMGLLQQTRTTFGSFGFYQSVPVQMKDIETIMEKFDMTHKNTSHNGQHKAILSEQGSITTPGTSDDETIELVKVFPYLWKLTIEGTSVTQHSLIEILNKLPFNEIFDVQSLIDQYSQICQISDETIIALARSKYLRNVEVLDLSKAEYSCDSIQQLINSTHSVNITELRLNCRNLNESVFINLAQTKSFPKLCRIKPTNFQNCYYSLGYLARAKYFDLSFDLEQSTLLSSKIIYQSNKFINNLISSIYMITVRQLFLDNMNDHMPALKEFFQLAKHCQNLEAIRLNNILDKQKYYYTWQSLASSPCFPNLRSISIEKIKFTENLNVLLQQKHKPLLDLNDIIQSEELIDNSTISTLSKQQILLNSTNLSLQKLKHVSKASWNELASSPYCFNVKSIDVSYDSLGNEIESLVSENEWPQHAVDATPQVPVAEKKSKSADKRSGNDKRKSQAIQEEIINMNFVNTRKLEILIKSNFVNLERLQIQGCEEFAFEDIEALLQSENHGKISIRFDFIGLLNQIAQIQSLPSIVDTESSLKLRRQLRSENFMERVLKKYRFTPLKTLDVSFFTLISIPKSDQKRVTPIETAINSLQIEFVNYLEVDQSPGIMDWLFSQTLMSRLPNLRAIQMKSFQKQQEESEETAGGENGGGGGGSVEKQQVQSDFEKQLIQAIIEALKLNRHIAINFDSTQFILSLQSNGLSPKFLQDLAVFNLYAQAGSEIINILISESIVKNPASMQRALPQVLKNTEQIVVHVLDGSKKALSTFMDQFLTSIPTLKQHLKISDFKIVSHITSSIKMSSTHFYQLCELTFFSEYFPLMDFFNEYIDPISTYYAPGSTGFLAMTKLACYKRQKHIIVSNVNLDYVALTPHCVDCEGNLAGILQLHTIPNLEKITFRNFSCNQKGKEELTKLAIKEFIGSSFVAQNPQIIIEYKIPIAESILQLLDPSYVTPQEVKGPFQVRKELEGAPIDESISSGFNPAFQQTNANFCAVSWLGAPVAVRRDWSREVTIIVEELRDRNHFITALKSILKHEEARGHLRSIELNSTSIALLIDQKPEDLSCFQDNQIEHIHFKSIQVLNASNLAKLEQVFITFQNLLTVTFDQKISARKEKWKSIGGAIQPQGMPRTKGMHKMQEKVEGIRLGQPQKPLLQGNNNQGTPSAIKNESGLNADNSPSSLFFMLAMTTRNVNIIDLVIRRFSSDLSKQNLETLRKNELIKHVTHISFKHNKNFEISSIKQKSMRGKSRGENSNIYSSMRMNQTNNPAFKGALNTPNQPNSLTQSAVITRGSDNQQEGFQRVQIEDRLDSSQRGLMASFTATQKRVQNVSSGLNASQIKGNSEIKPNSIGKQNKLQPLPQKGYANPEMTNNSSYGNSKAWLAGSEEGIWDGMTSKKMKNNEEDDEMQGLHNIAEEDQAYESDIKKYEQFTESEVDNLIDEKYLVNYFSSMESLQFIDFSFSTVKHEHTDALRLWKAINQVVFIDFKSCQQLTRILDLISLLSEHIPYSFQFDKFLESLPFTEIRSRKQVKKLIETILRTPFFQSHVQFFRLGFFEKIQLKGAVECFKGAFDPILSSSDRLNFNMSAFLQSLPGVLKQQVGDELIEFLTKQYSPITYLQPEHYSQVHYALNLIVQQGNISNDIRIMYMLNPRFQKCISATSFELVFESLIVHENDLLQQQQNLVSMRAGFVNQYFKNVKRVLAIQKQLDERQKEIQKLLSEKQDDLKSKLKINENIKKKTAEKQAAAKAQAEEKLKQDKLLKEREAEEARTLKEQLSRKGQDDDDMEKSEIQKSENADVKPLTDEEIAQQKKEQERKEREERRKKKKALEQRLEDQEKDGRILDDEIEELERLINEIDTTEYHDSSTNPLLNKLNNDLNKIQNFISKEDKDLLEQRKMLMRTTMDLDEQGNPWKKRPSFKTPKFEKKMNQERSESMDDEDELEDEKSNSIPEIPPARQSQHRDSILKNNLKGIRFNAKFNDVEVPDEASKARQEFESEQLVQKQTSIMIKTYKKMNKSDFELIDINKLKNSDVTLTATKYQLLHEIRDLAESIGSVNDHMLYLEHKRLASKKMVKESAILFEFFDSINLAYNKYFNQQGLNKYITSYIHPWLNMNTNFQEIQDKSYINMKIFTSKKTTKGALKVAVQDTTKKTTALTKKSKTMSKKDFQEQKAITKGSQNLAQLMNDNLVGVKKKENQRLNEQMEQMVRVNHGLDDAIIKNLTSIMQLKMEKIRKINLSGLNVGDAFAEQFSLVLSNPDKLTALRSVKLYHNRRLSSFGLKFLFSSIVKRIPDGFHINISPSMYDFSCLKKIIFLLERELVIKLYRLSKSIHSDQKKQFEERTAILDKFSKVKKNQVGGIQLQDKSLVALSRSQVLPTPLENQDKQPAEENRDDESILTEQELKDRVREALRNKNDGVLFDENQSMSSDWSDDQVSQLFYFNHY